MVRSKKIHWGGGDDKRHGTPLIWVPRFMGHVSLSLSAGLNWIDSNSWIGCQQSAPVLLLKAQKHDTLCGAIIRYSLHTDADKTSSIKSNNSTV